MPVLLYLLALAVFAQGTSEFVLAGLLPGIAHDLGTSLAEAGLLTSGFALGMVIGAPAMAAAGRRLPPRWTLTGFLALFILAHVVGAVAGDFGVLLASRLLAAFANAGFLAVALSTIAALVPAARLSRALSIVLGGITLALIAGVPAGALIGDLLGWRSTLWAISLLCVPALLAIVLAVPSGRMDADVSAEDAAGPVALRHELSALRTRPVPTSVVLAVLVNAATFCTFTYLAPVAIEGAGVAPGAVPLLLALFGVGAFLGVTIAGRIGDRRGRGLISLTAPLLMLGWAMLAASASVPWLLWALTPFLGALSFALGSTLVARVVAAATPVAPTMAGSFATAALNLGAVIGPVAGGAVIGVLGVTGPVMISAGLAALALACWWLLPGGRSDGGGV
ncbi:DHA1 family chloramphenicol resistance protein-like MFS transporter [Microbacterium resistens]|uniref:DHA1 family chloramphenicol resistance protein-like MFS transporter n=1 Tax=Microbacterium resistens TaxID=156977 RepID=A0ABU1SD51_9MICO|nr:Cmx/CmrA family chloramphenicol efflux MFS transporter [Microbacterium resistens]MDR6867499.1 DHA1 family chloramphenicol resistance protein-like MFS transporter [Microbacterium resistens]